MSPRVLLIDDSDDIRDIACMSLERVGGWSVVPVSSGQAALKAASNDGPFDAVLLDVMMPGMDGPCTLTALREHGFPAEVPIIFLTAKTQTADLKHLSSLGAAGVLNKPFDPLTLPDELQKLTLPN
jgi:two-component system, OmpR family, response regulator